MSVTLILPGHSHPLADIEEIAEALHHQVDLIIDGGHTGTGATSIIDLTQSPPAVIRVGKGNIEDFKP